MHDHEVDGAARSGIAARAVMGFRLTKGDGGVKASRWNGDHAHAVIHLDIVVDSVFAVHGVAGNARLEVAVHGRIDEQDSALIGNFCIVQFLRAKVDSCHSTRASRDALCGLHAVSGVLGVSCKAQGIRLRNNLCAHELPGESAERHADAFGVVNAIYEELPTAIPLRGVTSPSGGDIAANETTVAGVVAKTNHVGFKQIESLILVRPTHSILCGVKDGGLRFCFINFIQKRQIFGSQTDAISNSGANSSCHFYFSLFI